MQGNESYFLSVGFLLMLQKDPFLGSFLKLPKYRPLYTIVGTPKKVPLTLGAPLFFRRHTSRVRMVARSRLRPEGHTLDPKP